VADRGQPNDAGDAGIPRRGNGWRKTHRPDSFNFFLKEQPDFKRTLLGGGRFSVSKI
jgi:hypothetical protein